jgi:hypothetical protein
MCFGGTPKIPAAPPVPSKTAEDAQRRRQMEADASIASKGRQATIVTSPLGVSDFGQNINRTRLGGY